MYFIGSQVHPLTTKRSSNYHLPWPQKYDSAETALSLLRLNDLKFVDALAFGSAREGILGSRADVQTYKDRVLR